MHRGGRGDVEKSSAFGHAHTADLRERGSLSREERKLQNADEPSGKYHKLQLSLSIFVTSSVENTLDKAGLSKQRRREIPR